MSGYIGNIPVPQATQTRDTFTATASQTTFATSGYTPSFLDVFLNGVHLVNGTDYTASNGSDVVLTSGAAASDVLEVVSYRTFEVNSQNFTGSTTIADLDVTGAFTATDLTLSGGVYLGGTGSANYLDDYEEGTWTPTDGSGAGLTFTVDFAKYTKIGNVCHLQAYFTYPSTADGNFNRINGLPFATQTNGFAAFYVNSNTEVMAQLEQGATYLRLKDLSNSSYINSSLSGRFIIFSGTYITT